MFVSKMTFKVFLLITLAIACHFSFTLQDNPDDIYGFNATDIDGNEVSFEKYRGYVLIVVNVASECTLTDSNYKQLNELYQKYESKGLRIAAFPSNQFAGQEPGDSETIKKFITEKNVKFDVYSKVDVNGDNAHPIYKWLKTKAGGSFFIDMIKWNFTKFLLNCHGQAVKRYGPLEQPKSLEADIVKELENREAMQKLNKKHEHEHLK